MEIRGLSQEEEDWIRELIGNADPEDRLRIQRVPTGYIVDLKPSEADLQKSRRSNSPPIKLKAASCLNFYELITAVVDCVGELSK